MVNDVRRAYFYAKLPLCLYGTRDAAKEWQKMLSRHLQEIGFSPGRGHPAVFHHPERDMRVLVHGDDYLTSGHVGDLDWMKSKFKDIYEIQTQRVGSGVGQTVEGQILNRIVRSTPSG